MRPLGHRRSGMVTLSEDKPTNGAALNVSGETKPALV
jgi:hypothetical protein